MSLRPSLNEQDLLADTLRRAEQRLPARERNCEIVIGAGFLLAVAGLWAVRPPGSFSILPAGFCLLVLVVATTVRFDTPFGFTVATQLAFVPLMFAVPPTLAPLFVALALALVRLPRVITGQVPKGRLLRSLGNSWFAIGPVAVLAVSGTAPRDAGPLLLIAALLAQFSVDFAVSAIRMSIERGATLRAQLEEVWVYGIDAGLSGFALVVGEDVHRSPIAALAPLPLLALLSVFARERHERMEGLLALNAAYRGTALVLGDVIDNDDGYTGEHSRGVVRLALALANHLGLDADRCRNVEFAAMLHDVGKIAIPKEIINKPGSLTPEEWTVIQTHTIEGQRMLDRIGGFMQNVGQIVRSHHERWDGTGYPDGLLGEAIPLEARIITCCDSWNAMRTDRSYRLALSYEVARAELTSNAGTQFDPRLLAIFLTMLEETGESQAPTQKPLAPNPAPA